MQSMRAKIIIPNWTSLELMRDYNSESIASSISFASAHAISQPPDELVTCQAIPVFLRSETLERQGSKDLLAGCRRLRRSRLRSGAQRGRRRRRPGLRPDGGCYGWRGGGRRGGGRLAGVFLIGRGVVGDQRHRGGVSSSGGRVARQVGLPRFRFDRDVGCDASGPELTIYAFS